MAYILRFSKLRKTRAYGASSEARAMAGAAAAEAEWRLAQTAARRCRSRRRTIGRRAPEA